MSEQFIYLDLRDPHPQFLGTIAVSTIVCSILPRLLTPRGSFWCTEPIHGPSSQAITGHFIPRAIVTMVDGDVLLSCIVHLESDVVLPRSWRHISRPRRPRLDARIKVSKVSGFLLSAQFALWFEYAVCLLKLRVVGDADLTGPARP